jgi:RHS repeat-associated protein
LFVVQRRRKRPYCFIPSSSKSPFRTQHRFLIVMSSERQSQSPRNDDFLQLGMIIFMPRNPHGSRIRVRLRFEKQACVAGERFREVFSRRLFTHTETTANCWERIRSCKTCTSMPTTTQRCLCISRESGLAYRLRDREPLVSFRDRLGSSGKYYPYGEPRGTVPQDAVGFATYTNDSATGLQYADQRYYANNWGRFMSPDPYSASGGSGSPASWNRYSYTRGDPVNRSDRTGLEDREVDDGDCDPDNDDCTPTFTVTHTEDGGGGGDPEPDPPAPDPEPPPDPTPAPDPPAPPAPAPVKRKRHKPKFNPCANKADVAFLKNNLADAAKLAAALNVPVQFVLAVAADESQYGGYPTAIAANNFFWNPRRLDSGERGLHRSLRR